MLREIRNDDADRQEERDEEGELVELGRVVAGALQGKTFPRDRCKCRERKRRHRAGGRASWKRRRREARLGLAAGWCPGSDITQRVFIMQGFGSSPETCQLFL